MAIWTYHIPDETEKTKQTTWRCVNFLTPVVSNVEQHSNNNTQEHSMQTSQPIHCNVIQCWRALYVQNNVNQCQFSRDPGQGVISVGQVLNGQSESSWPQQTDVTQTWSQNTTNSWPQQMRRHMWQRQNKRVATCDNVKTQQDPGDNVKQTQSKNTKQTKHVAG